MVVGRNDVRSSHLLPSLPSKGGFLEVMPFLLPWRWRCHKVMILPAHESTRLPTKTICFGFESKNIC